jgi:hypothetical protein
MTWARAPEPLPDRGEDLGTRRFRPPRAHPGVPERRSAYLLFLHAPDLTGDHQLYIEHQLKRQLRLPGPVLPLSFDEEHGTLRDVQNARVPALLS